MIQQLIDAVCGEVQEIFINDIGTTVLRDTQFDESETPSHNLPLVIVGLGDSPDMQQLSGGVTQAEWNWVLRCYFIDSNADLSPDQAFSTGSYGIIETIVNHFNYKQWLTQAFRDVEQIYSFKINFEDVSKAPALQKNDGGMIPGYQVIYSSIALDARTSHIVYSDTTLQKVEQVPLSDLSFSATPLTVNIDKPINSIGTFDVTATTPWIIQSIPPWLAVDIYEGFGDATVTITATANASTTNRTGNIVLSAPLSGIADVTISVVQLGI
jgi:hypothetical protein